MWEMLNWTVGSFSNWYYPQSKERDYYADRTQLIDILHAHEIYLSPHFHYYVSQGKVVIFSEFSSRLSLSRLAESFFTEDETRILFELFGLKETVEKLDQYYSGGLQGALARAPKSLVEELSFFDLQIYAEKPLLFFYLLCEEEIVVALPCATVSTYPKETLALILKRLALIKLPLQPIPGTLAWLRKLEGTALETAISSEPRWNLHLLTERQWGALSEDRLSPSQQATLNELRGEQQKEGVVDLANQLI